MHAARAPHMRRSRSTASGATLASIRCTIRSTTGCATLAVPRLAAHCRTFLCTLEVDCGARWRVPLLRQSQEVAGLPFNLPTTATAPCCPSEVQGTVAVAQGAPLWKRIMQFAGPGLLISIGYMDPGNWATDIEAGSPYGYSLPFGGVLARL